MGPIDQQDDSRPALVRYCPLAVVLVAASVGVVADRYWHPHYAGLLCGSAGLLGVWWTLWRRRQLAVSSVMLVFSLALASAAWHHLYWRLYSPYDLARFAGEAEQPVCLEAVAVGAPRRIPAPPFTPLRAFTSGDRSRLVVRPVRVRDGQTWRATSGKSTLTVDGHLLGVRAGDCLRIFGQLSRPRPAANPGQFDFAEHARADRLLTQLRTDFPDCVSVVDRAHAWTPLSGIDDLRVRGLAVLARYLPPERLGLAAALLLGVREQLDLERNEEFLATGTVHILSISGMHVGMIASLFFLMLRVGLAPRRATLIVVALATIVYALVADSGAPVVRATVIVLTTCLALALVRRRSIFNALALAAIIVLVMNPTDLFRIGTQLSFLSVATIFWVGPRLHALGEIHDPLDRLLAQSRGWPIRAARWLGLNLVRLFLLSFSVWVVIAPLVLARFHVLSPIALLLNLVLWFPVAVALLAGFALLICGAFVPGAGQLFGWACEHGVAAIDVLVRWGDAAPGSHAWLPGPANWWLIGLYLGLVLGMAFPRWVPPRRWCLAWIAVWLSCGFLLGSTGTALARRLANPDRAFAVAPTLRCTFLSVGHGLAVVLELPNGEVLLYDDGQLGSPTAAARTAAGYLWSRGITHLDAVVISHADLDHFNGLPELMKKFSVGAVYVSPMMFEQPAASTAALTAALAEQHVPVSQLSAGDRLRGDPACRIEVLHPTRTGVLGSDNANSLVLAIEFGGRRIVLTGDLETPGLEAVLAEESYDCDVLLAPHHGSTRSNPSGMARWCRPEWVVISGGFEVDPRVVQSYRAGGAKVLHTAETGAVTVELSSEGVSVEAFRRARD